MTTGYLINLVLLAMVVPQLRERRVDLPSLLLPVALVAAAADYYLRSIPTGGNDLVLIGGCVAAGATMGYMSARFTHIRRATDGTPLARLGMTAASLWIAGVGARMVFAYAADHGAGPSIGRFSVAHHITGASAWVAALVAMALADVVTRQVSVRVRAAGLPHAIAAPMRPATPVAAQA